MIIINGELSTHDWDVNNNEINKYPATSHANIVCRNKSIWYLTATACTLERSTMDKLANGGREQESKLKITQAIKDCWL